MKLSSFSFPSFVSFLFSYLFKEDYVGYADEIFLYKSIHPYLKNISFSSFETFLKQWKKDTEDDLKFYYEKDPAMKTYEEILLTNESFRAIVLYRISHYFYINEERIFAFYLMNYAKEKSGIEIHPGARIDVPFFIDHGLGTVIGETTVIGKRVQLYQGVTLGAKTLKEGRKLVGIKRHPTLEDDVIVYAHAMILGDICVKKGEMIKVKEILYKE